MQKIKKWDLLNSKGHRNAAAAHDCQTLCIFHSLAYFRTNFSLNQPCYESQCNRGSVQVNHCCLVILFQGSEFKDKNFRRQNLPHLLLGSFTAGTGTIQSFFSEPPQLWLMYFLWLAQWSVSPAKLQVLFSSVIRQRLVKNECDVGSPQTRKTCQR